MIGRSFVQIVTSILASNGYSQAQSAAEADVVLLNTCSIREKAEAKIFSRLGVLRNTKSARNGQALGQRQQVCFPFVLNIFPVHLLTGLIFELE